jgi:hypothetical protein
MQIASTKPHNSQNTKMSEKSDTSLTNVERYENYVILYQKY